MRHFCTTTGCNEGHPGWRPAHTEVLGWHVINPASEPRYPELPSRAAAEQLADALNDVETMLARIHATEPVSAP